MVLRLAPHPDTVLYAALKIRDLFSLYRLPVLQVHSWCDLNSPILPK